MGPPFLCLVHKWVEYKDKDIMTMDRLIGVERLLGIFAGSGEEKIEESQFPWLDYMLFSQSSIYRYVYMYICIYVYILSNAPCC